MEISSSWTFWKGETKIYNFHVEQIFIWSFFGHVILRSKTFHFWKLPLQVTFYFWKFLSWLYFLHSWAFDMSNDTCFNMSEVYPTLSHLQIHKIKHSWPQLTFSTDRWNWQCIDQIELQSSTEMAQGWNPSLNNLHSTIRWSPDPI